MACRVIVAAFTTLYNVLAAQVSTLFSLQDAHLYDYVTPVDDDLMCLICRQPLVDPVDTDCGHTFCRQCALNYLTLKSTCPLDRRPLDAARLRPATFILKK